MVPACSVKVPRVSTYSGSRLVNSPFAYGAFTLSGRLSQNRSARLIESIPRSEPHGARTMVWALPVSLAATSGITVVFATSGITVVFSSSGYLDVSVHRVPFLNLWIGLRMTGVCPARFPYSEISGSIGICPSPKLFAAYHVLHRLLVPRHPPYALISMTRRLFSTGMENHLHMYSVTCAGNRSIFSLRFLRRILADQMLLITFPRMSCISSRTLSSPQSHIRYFSLISVCSFQGT